VTDAFVHTVAVMGTVVTVQIVGHGADERQIQEREAGAARAVEWFRQVEQTCSRFDPDSEIRQLSLRIGVPVPASAMLYEAVQFALAVAAESGGAFDPTVGLLLEAHGFDREYRSGNAGRTPIEPGNSITHRDVRLDPDQRTITLLRPLLLDLGAVAKGLAIDMAARELQPFENFAIDAGGDLYLAGRNADRQPWSVGIRHPRDDRELLDTFRVSDTAVCTSGDYERRSRTEENDAAHHIMDPRTGASASASASVTVIAASAMVADALATAAFVLGPAKGLQLLERHGVDGFIVTPSLERFTTKAMAENPAITGGRS
jgi:thiamine biosynthesis lipoprotein